MKCNDAFSKLINGSFDFNRPAKDIKIDLIEISSHINHLYNSDVNGFQKALLDKMTSISKEIEKARGEGNVTNLLTNLTHLNSILTVDAKKLFEDSFEIFSNDEKKHFPLAEQENTVMEAVGFLTDNTPILPVIKKVFKGYIDGIRENVFAIDGPAGTGKTQFIVKNALRIFAKFSKTKPKVMTIAEDPVKASDLFAEISGDKNIESIGNKGFTTASAKNDKKSISEADIIVIDEASLMTQEDFYIIAKHKKKGAKIIMLFDSDQVSTAMFKGKADASSEGIFKSRKLKSRFRTTSQLNIDAFDTILSDRPLLTEEQYNTKFAKAINSESDLLIGVNSTSSTNQITDNEERIDAIIDSFNEDVGGQTLLENIKEQSSRAKNKFTLFISTDAANADAVIRKKMPELFKIKGLEVKVLDTQSIQGSEADYVIADLPHLNKIKGGGLQNDFLKRITNMLLSRSRFYTHIVNTAGYNMKSEQAPDNTYSYLTSDVILSKANIARSIYEEMYEQISGKTIDPGEKITLDEELEVISDKKQFIQFLKDYDKVDLNNPPESFIIKLIDKAKSLGVILNKNEDEMSINDIRNQLEMMEKLMDDLDGRYNNVFDDYISKLEILLDEKKQELEDIYVAKLTRIAESLDESTEELVNEMVSIIGSSGKSNLSAKKLARFEELQNVISARDALSEMTAPKKQSLDLMNEKVNTMIAYSGLTTEEGIVKFFQDNGFAYLYEDTMKSNLGEEEFAKRNLGSDITNEKLNDLIDSYKKSFYRMGTKHTSEALETGNSFEILFIKDKGKIRIVLLENKTKTIMSQLNLDGQMSKSFFDKIDQFVGKNEYKSISITGDNIMKTAGPIVSSPSLMPVSGLLTNLDNIEGLQRSQPLTIKDIGVKEMAGQTAIFYSYSNIPINFASEDFKSWSQDNFLAFTKGNYKGVYIDNNGIKHSIGYIPLNHKRFSFSRLNDVYVDGIEEASQAGRNISDIGKINSSFNNSKRLVEFFSVVSDVLSIDKSNSLEELSNEIKNGERGSQLFGISNEDKSAPDLIKESNENAKKTILDLFNSMSPEAKRDIKDIITFVSEKTGLIRTDDSGNVVMEEVDFTKGGETQTTQVLGKIFGSVLTYIPKGEINGVANEEFSYFDLVSFLKIINTTTDGKSSEVLSFFDSVMELKSDEKSIFGFFGTSETKGIKVDPQLDRTGGALHITLLPNASESKLSMDEVFEVNVSSVDKPRIIVDFNKSIEEALIKESQASPKKEVIIEEYDESEYDQSDKDIEAKEEADKEIEENNVTFVESNGVKISISDPSIESVEDLIAVVDSFDLGNAEQFKSMDKEQKERILRGVSGAEELKGREGSFVKRMRRIAEIENLFNIC